MPSRSYRERIVSLERQQLSAEKMVVLRLIIVSTPSIHLPIDEDYDSVKEFVNRTTPITKKTNFLELTTIKFIVKLLKELKIIIY